MNDVANTPANPIVQFKRDLRSIAGELVLPSNVPLEAFQNAAIVAVQDNPKILKCERNTVFKALRRLAAAGLVPDGREAALVPFSTKINDKYVDACQAMPMVFGLIKAARNSGEVADIRAHIVYQREVDEDRFSYVVGDVEKLEHRPILFGDRGEAVACYAVAQLRDGSLIREFMTAEEIEKVRRAGASQKIFAKGKKPVVSEVPKGIWADWTEEMWKKTAIRRLCKRLPVSSEDMRRIETTDRDTEPKDITPTEPETPQERAKRLQSEARAAQQQDAPTEAAESAPDVVEGEVVDQVPVDPDHAVFKEGIAAYEEFGPAATMPEDYTGREFEETNWWAGWKAAHNAKKETEE